MSTCNDPRINLFNLINQQNAVPNFTIEGELPIEVSKTSVDGKDTYLVRYREAFQLIASMVISSIITNPADKKNGIVPLNGAIVEEVNLAWSFKENGVEVNVSQNLDGTIYDSLIKSAQLQGLNITIDSVDKDWTIYGDNELEQVGSTAQATATLVFGEMVYVGEGIIPVDDAALRTLVQSLSGTIKEQMTVNYTPQSLDPTVYVYVAIPSSKGIFSFKDENSPLDIDPLQLIKQDFSINNGHISINYNIYRSKNGSLRGAKIVTR